MSVVLDTHAAIWYFHRVSHLSAVALKAIRHSVSEGRPVYVSAISLVETIYLVERGRLPLESLHRLDAGLNDSHSGVVVQSVDEDIARAVQGIARTRVPDMPDRIIAATALHLGIPLVTKDERILSAGIQTIW